MACVVYRGSEKALVDPRAVEGMIAQGWSREPDNDALPPSAEDFKTFLNMHEELKRVTDTALSLRDDQIHELVNMNEVLTEEIDSLQAENIELKSRLDDYERQANDAFEAANDNEAEEPKAAHKPYADMKIQTLKANAKRAKIPNWASLRKSELIDALQNWELNNGSQSAT